LVSAGRLAAGLRQLRQEAELTQEQVAAAIVWSMSKISRTETAVKLALPGRYNRSLISYETPSRAVEIIDEEHLHLLCHGNSPSGGATYFRRGGIYLLTPKTALLTERFRGICFR
jgi:DNA-binding XRE family transcriptional regulator